MTEDPYKILGIAPGASKEEIKKAYHQKAKQYHPDLHPDDPEASKMMNRINEAYDMLNNPEKYNRQQGNPSRSGYPGQSYAGQSGSGRSYSGQTSYDQRHSGQSDNAQWHSYRSGQDYGSGRQNTTGSGYDWFDDFSDIFGSFNGFGQSASIPHPKVEPGDSADIRQAVDMINLRRYSYAADILNGIISTQRNARWYYLSALTNHGLGNTILASEQINRAVNLEPQNQTFQRTKKAFGSSRETYASAGEGFQQYAETMGKFCMGAFALQFLCMFCCR